jgi:SAM-dependent methyltransferase
MTAEDIQPTTIQALMGAVPKAYALLAALQLGVFAALADGPLTAEEVSRRVGGDPRRLRSLLYYLIPAGLLIFAEGRFANTQEADRFLVRGRPGSFADGADLTAEIWLAYSRVADSIRAGHALARHDYAAMSPDELMVAYRGMDRGVRGIGAWLAGQVDFSTIQSVVDVGGGSGGLAVVLTERYRHLRATVADLPSVIPITQRFLAEAGARDRVDTVAVDLRTTPVPGTYDAAVLSSVVQLFDRDLAGRVVRNVGMAVRQGGALYINAFALDDTRLAPERGLWFNFAAIGFYETGEAYTETDYRAWLEDAGFGEIAFRVGATAADPPVAIIARKLRP